MHGFSTRALGDMRRRDGEPLTADRRRFAAALGLDPAAITFAGAVHGGEVARVDRPMGVAEGFDALVTDRPGLPLFATFADCFPILLHDPGRRAIALAHAGWRGTAAGVAANAVAALAREYGTRPGDLVVGIGPGICGRCYEVGDEVSARFPAGCSRPGRDGRALLDLAEANRRGLVAAGVDPARIHELGVCTMEDARLPSHRRDADGDRFACLIALR